MSKTPQSDALVAKFECVDYMWRDKFNDAINLCRELERENAALQATMKPLDSANDAFIGHIQLMADLLSPDQKNGAVQILNLKRENAELRERLEILSKSNEKQTEEYICVDREYGLWKRAAIDAARKEKP